MTDSSIFWDTPYAPIEAALADARRELRRFWAGHLALLPWGAPLLASPDLNRTPEDRICDEIIRASLSRTSFNVPIVSEEDVVAPTQVSKTAFLVDPLDGTHNALMGYPAYTASVAFFDGATAKFGWVYDITRDVTYLSVAGRGASLETPLAMRPLKTTARSSLEDLALAVMRSCEVDPRFDYLIRFARKIRISSCASLDLCLIASGALDGFVDVTTPGHERSCDIAAAALILREAGGSLLTLKGSAHRILAPCQQALVDRSPLVGVCCEQAGVALIHALTYCGGRRS